MGWVIVLDDEDDIYKNMNCCTMVGMTELQDFIDKHRKDAPTLAECGDYLFLTSERNPDLIEEINRVRPQATCNVRPILDNIKRAAKKAEYYFEIRQ